MGAKTKIISSYGTIKIGGSDMGYTRGGVSIAKTYDTREVEADQTKYPLYIQNTKEGYAIHFALLEFTVAHLRDVWGEAATVVGASLSLGKASDNPVDKTIVVYALRKDAKYVKFTFYTCNLASVDNSEMTRDGEALLGATFNALFNDTYNGIGVVEEVDTP
jgi:hypothetical protein